MSAQSPKSYEHGSIEEALFLLEKSGLKRTKTREALLDVLVRKHGPFSVDEIRALARGCKLDQVTVYRNLAAFERIGLVRRCEFGDGTSRYEFQCEHEHHHHVICVVCRQTENIETCSLEKIEKQLQKKGYSAVSHTLEFFGVCKSCRAAHERR